MIANEKYIFIYKLRLPVGLKQQYCASTILEMLVEFATPLVMSEHYSDNLESTVVAKS